MRAHLLFRITLGLGILPLDRDLDLLASFHLDLSALLHACVWVFQPERVLPGWYTFYHERTLFVCDREPRVRGHVDPRCHRAVQSAADLDRGLLRREHLC